MLLSNESDLIILLISYLLFFGFVDKTCAHNVKSDVLLCRSCGHDIVKAADLRNIPATKVLQSREATILDVPGVLVQYLQNPQKSAFEVITAKDAHVNTDTNVYHSDSWFEDTAWQITRCPRCHSQIGWKYQPVDYEEGDGKEELFHGLILNHLIHEDYANSVILKHMKNGS